MDNNNTQMENWKKQIVMDPTLNKLFDPTISAEDLLIKKILTLPHDQIVNIYTQMATIKHSLSKSLQKQIQTKSQHIQKAFLSSLQYRQQYDQKGNAKLKEKINYLKKFNMKYEFVENSVTKWRNICKILHFSKDLQTLRVNTNILHTLMRGYNGQQDTINSFKISKIIKELSSLSTCNDFSGIQSYQTEKVFIMSTKSIIHQIAKKNIQKIMTNEQITNNQTQNIHQPWIQVFVNLGTLRQFITTYFKSLLIQLGEKVKQALKQPTINDLNINLQNRLIPFLFIKCLKLIFLEKSLKKYRKLDFFENVPNLFIKFWQKAAQFIQQTLNWVRKQQKSRNHPKNHENSIIWKYPTLYTHFSRLCDNLHYEIVSSQQIKNKYSFSTMKQKMMMLFTDIGIQYHQKCKQRIKQIIYSEQSPQKIQENILKLFRQANNYQIIASIVNYLCQTLNGYKLQKHINSEKISQIKLCVIKYIQNQENNIKGVLSSESIVQLFKENSKENIDI